MPTTRKKVVKTVYKDEDDSEEEKGFGDFSDSGSEAEHFSSDDYASSADEFDGKSKKKVRKSEKKITENVRKTNTEYANIIHRPSTACVDDELATEQPLFSVKDLIEEGPVSKAKETRTASNKNDMECESAEGSKSCPDSKDYKNPSKKIAKNYTKEEVDRLLTLIEPRLVELDAHSLKRKKSAWQEIVHEFNAFPVSGVVRSEACLRKKFERIKHNLSIILKKYTTIENVKLIEKKRGKRILNPWDERLLKIVDKQDIKRRDLFQLKEVHRLLSLIEARRNIVEGRKYDSDSLERRRVVWQDIEREFNSPPLTEVYRSASSLSKKYEAMKCSLNEKLKRSKVILKPWEKRLARLIAKNRRLGNKKHKFTKEDEDRLLSLIEVRKDILECAETESTQSVWQDIEREFNSSRPASKEFRSAVFLQKKYTSIKNTYIGLNKEETGERNERLERLIGNKGFVQPMKTRFTNEEIDKLVFLMEKEDSQKYDPNSLRITRTDWQHIELEYNSAPPVTGTYRSSYELRIRFSKIKSYLRNKLRNTSIEQIKLNEGLSGKKLLLPWEERLARLMDKKYESDDNADGPVSDHAGRPSTPREKVPSVAVELNPPHTEVGFSNGESKNDSRLTLSDHAGRLSTPRERLSNVEPNPPRTDVENSDCKSRNDSRLTLSYTNEENERILSLVESRIQIIENGERGVKEKAWKDIEQEFNKFTKKEGREFRNFNSLRTKYFYWKKVLCRKQAAKNNEVELNPLERKLKAIIDGMNKSEPNENMCKDSDGADDDDGNDSDAAGGAGGDGSHSEVSEHAGGPSTARERVPSVAVEPNPPHTDFGNSCKSGDGEYSTHNPGRKRTFDGRVTKKLQVVSTKKQMVQDELKTKRLKLMLMKEEEETKKEMFQLKKEKLKCHLDELKREREHKIEMFEQKKQEAMLRSEVLQRKLQFYQETEEC